jgi:hypothetical protein
MCPVKIRFANDALVCCPVQPQADYCISNEEMYKCSSKHINSGPLKAALSLCVHSEMV